MISIGYSQTFDIRVQWAETNLLRTIFNPPVFHAINKGEIGENEDKTQTNFGPINTSDLARGAKVYVYVISHIHYIIITYYIIEVLL